MDNNIKNTNKKNLVISIIILTIIVIIAIASYALTLWNSTVNTELTMRIGDVAGVFFETGPNINVSNLGPVFNYEDGEETYFTVTNYTNTKIEVTAKLNITSISDELKKTYFKYVVLVSEDNLNYEIINEGDFSNSSNGDTIILTDGYDVTANAVVSFKVILYINGNVENPVTMQGDSLEGVISVSANEASNTKWNTTTTIDSSNANIPAYTDGLVPVMYDTNTSNWVVADTTSSTSTYGWYDYDTKNWANAVLVTDDKRESLTTDSNGYYTPGQSIGDLEEEGVLAFYVWIPRYKYKVWNINKVADSSAYTYDAYTNGIDIEFEEGTATTGGISCNYSFAAPVATAGSPNEECTDTTGEGYYTHPAFTFGEDELTGFWMGKFEISSTDQEEDNYGAGTNALALRVLPNVMSWRFDTVSSFWSLIKNMQASGNIYGVSTDITVADSHMLTNMEWGAVAYLTHSEYGRCTDDTCTEVATNNSGKYSYFTNYTGRSSGVGGSSGYSADGTYTYEEPNGQLASTTGNIYGVYDMSGGAYEYVMGNISSLSGDYTYNPNLGSGSYTYTGNEKYITTYAYGTTYNNQQAYNRARLGDATSEVLTIASSTGGWYGDYAIFPDSSNSWFLRGGSFDDGSAAGVFSFGNYHGDSTSAYTARAALVGFPQ